MKKRSQQRADRYRTWDITRGMEYAPVTPPGATALEHRGNGGVFRPGKTRRDWPAK